jgi:hypothetical protein
MPTADVRWDHGGMHLLCVVEDSLPGRHVANIATDIARRMEARLTLVTADRGREEAAASALRYDMASRATGVAQDGPLDGAATVL